MNEQYWPVQKLAAGRPVNWLSDRFGKFQITAEELGKSLGYAHPKRRVLALVDKPKNRDEIAPHKGVLRLSTPGGEQETIVFTEVGAWIIAMKSNAQYAKEIRLHIAELLTRFSNGDLIAIPRQQRERELEVIDGLRSGTLQVVPTQFLAQQNKHMEACYESMKAQRVAITKMASLGGQMLNLKKHYCPPDPDQLQLPYGEPIEVRRIA